MKKMNSALAKQLAKRNTPAARIHRALRVLYKVSPARDVSPLKQKQLIQAIRLLEKIVGK